MLAKLTESQEKALIEAVTKALKGWVDAWEHIDSWERDIAVQSFLAGVRWAQKRAATEGQED